MRPQRFVIAALVVAAVAGLAGCAGGEPTVSATPSAPPSPAAPRASGPLADPDSPRRIVYDEQLVSDPLPASRARSARSMMSAAQAVDIARKQAIVAPAQQPGAPKASLRLVYDGRPGGARKVTGKPAWLLTWRDSEPVIRGPVTMTEDQRRKMAADLECVFVVTVDPGSRTATRAGQICEKKSP